MTEQATISRVTIRTASGESTARAGLRRLTYDARNARLQGVAGFAPASGPIQERKDSVHAESHPDSEGGRHAPVRRSNDGSEAHDQPGRGPGKIEPSPAVDRVDQVERAERAEVAQVEPQADMRPEEEHGAATKVPRRLGFVDAREVRQCVNFRAHHAESRERIRPKADARLAADWNPDQQIAGRRQHAAAAEVRPAVEIRTVCDVPLEADNPSAHEGETGTPVEPLRIHRP